MKKNLLVNFVLFAAFMLLAVNFAFAQDLSKVSGGIATLYALDPLSQTLCFEDGKEGKTIQQNQVRNRCSDIDFNAYKENSFSVGIEGGRNGVIIDIGMASELQKRYGYTETVGGGQGFASLRVANGKAFILKDYKSGSEQDLAESSSLFTNGNTNVSVPVKLGHIYLLRITDRNDKSFERFFKLIVVSYKEGEYVTIRWQTM